MDAITAPQGVTIDREFTIKSKDIVKRTEAVADVIAAIKEQGIVHMVIDPFVSTHLGVSENSNEEMEQVMETVQQIAHETGCSIDLIHHSLKSHSGNTELSAGDMNSARGAGSQIGAVRIMYTVTQMSKDTAGKMGIDRGIAARLIRLDHGKGNYVARDVNTRWFELAPYDIGNGNLFSEGDPVMGDTIAVLKPWRPPADKTEASEAVEHAGKMQQVRDVVAGAMSSDRCTVSEVFPAIEQEFSVKESKARTLLKDAIPEGEEVTADVGSHTYLLKIEREEPAPPGRLFVVRREIAASLAEAA